MERRSGNFGDVGATRGSFAEREVLRPRAEQLERESPPLSLNGKRNFEALSTDYTIAE